MDDSPAPPRSLRTIAAPPSRDFIALLKPRVMSLVVFTGIAGMALAPGTLHPVLACVAVLCIAVGAGAAGAINMWYERDIDAVMRRTRDRVRCPRGAWSPRPRSPSASCSRWRSVMLDGARGQLGRRRAARRGDRVLRLRLHDVAQAPDAAEHRHRRRGRRLPADDRLGGGDAAMSVSAALILFAMIFMWTPPHFWALALYKSDEYARCRRSHAAGGCRARPRRGGRYSFTLWRWCR